MRSVLYSSGFDHVHHLRVRPATNSENVRVFHEWLLLLIRGIFPKNRLERPPHPLGEQKNLRVFILKLSITFLFIFSFVTAFFRKPSLVRCWELTKWMTSHNQSYKRHKVSIEPNGLRRKFKYMRSQNLLSLWCEYESNFS